MTVLVIRPEPLASQLCTLLEAKGVRALHHSVVQFKANEACKTLPALLADSHIIIAVSKSAVEYASDYLKSIEQHWPSNALYFAIGQKSAHDFSEMSQQKVHYPLVGDSVHFLALPELLHVSLKNVVILRGNGGRELIFDTLRSRGANVKYCETYQRSYVRFDAELKVPFWQSQGVDTLVVTSNGQLDAFISGFDCSQYSWLLGLRLFVPSQRVSDEASQYGFTNIVNVGSASNFDLLAAIVP